MLILEIAVTVGAGYLILVLLLEAVIWKVQPDMDGVVTLHVNTGDTIVKRKLYGLEYNSTLYVSSNHWFRKWYHAIVENPDIKVERADTVGLYTATPIDGDEHTQVALQYNMGFILRLLCGFAPQRFLRLDARATEESA